MSGDRKIIHELSYCRNLFSGKVFDLPEEERSILFASVFFFINTAFRVLLEVAGLSIEKQKARRLPGFN